MGCKSIVEDRGKAISLRDVGTYICTEWVAIASSSSALQGGKRGGEGLGKRGNLTTDEGGFHK